MKKNDKIDSVDFYVDSRPLTDDERKRISDFIRADKEKSNKRKLKITSKNKKRSSI